MMATSTATGTCDTQGLSATIKNSKNTPANKVDKRPRPPYFTLLTVWPIMPQPAMPPNRLEAILARPRPLLSRFLELGVSVSSSTTLAVIMDSSRPTIAIAKAGSAIRRRVSSDQGTSGRANEGKDCGSSPRSATVLSGSCSPTAKPVTTTIATSGDGTARVRRGNR